ncbi:MFS transporter [bacterium]|nr:MFS transporter [bacterium]
MNVSTHTAERPQTTSIFKAVPAVVPLLWFQIFNAVSYNIVTDTPMVLLLQRWNAPEIYKGTLSAMMWLMATMQLVMATRVEYIGFRRLLLAGWTSRTVVLMVVCILPFLSTPDNHVMLLTITMACMIVWSLLRGVATTAYQPWVRTLIAPQWRGRYFSLEQLTSNLSAAAMLLCWGLVLMKHDLTDPQYGIIFVVSAIAGWVSIVFLRKVDSPPPLPGKPIAEPVIKWMPRVWAEKGFRKQIIVTILFYLSIGAFRLYTTVMLRDKLKFSENTILFFNAATLMAVVLSAWPWGLLADRFGSRPIMSLATRVLLVLLAFWFVLTLGVIPANPWLLGAFYTLFGLGFNGFHISNQRMYLNSAPKKFPVLALSTIQVFYSLSFGVSPLLWGGALDVMKKMKWTAWGMEIDRYTIFFGVSLVILLAAKYMIRRLPNETGVMPRRVLSYVMVDVPANIFKK